jgi:hypothetical protein
LTDGEGGGRREKRRGADEEGGRFYLHFVDFTRVSIALSEKELWTVDN